MQYNTLQYVYNSYKKVNCKTATAFPPTDNIRAMVIVWRVRGEIIWPALCCCTS